MNENFEHQKERLLTIKQEISLLYQQVNYLLRKEKPLELLDLDVLMNRTHTLYDLLCAINVGDESIEEDLPLDADALAGLFGGMNQEMPEDEPVEEPEPEEEEVPVEEAPEVSVETSQPELEEEAPVEEEEEVLVKETPEVSVETPQPEPEIEVPVEEEELKEAPVVEQPEESYVVEEESVEPEPEETPAGDEYGLFFRFEDAPAEEEEKEDAVEQGGKVVHVVEEIPEEEIPERDRVYGEDLVKDNPLVMPRVDEEWAAERDEIERESSEGVDVFGRDDSEFELSTGETLGERMMGEDNSLAAKLQQNPVRDLKKVIGINEKFLFVNELFGGSMEKYNQAIENLNDLKTLNGAIIYLNELKIELQWNSSNEAYQKLKELVNRKFE